MFLQILFYILMAFAGYVIGRFSHCYLNVWTGNLKWAPHHWIYGFILIIAGLFFYGYSLGITAFSFGAGLFISDLKDFFGLKFFEPDQEGKKKFWDID